MTMMSSRRSLLTLAAIAIAAVAMPAASPVSMTASPLFQNREFGITITGSTGAKPKLAIPEFSVVGGNAEVQQAAKTIAEVLWDDIEFEQEFTMVARDAAAKIPAAKSATDLPYDRWREVGADAVMLGTVSQTSAGFSVEIQAVGTRGDNARLVMFGSTYSGCNLKTPRRCAHFIADDFHKKQRNLDGVAQTKLAFSSDRNNESVTGRVVTNASQEIYIADYDGANPQRITVNRSLNIAPSWSPDGKSLAYMSFSSRFPDIYIQNLYEVRQLVRPAGGTDLIQNKFPAFSPDGTKIAFNSTRDGNDEIYVVNRDGTGLKRLTSHPNIDVAPAWSPNGTQIVFVSGRSGEPQLYLMEADGTGLQRLPCGEQQCDHPSWSPPPQNKIVYTCGPSGFYEICVLDLTTRAVAKLTNGPGSNEQPSFAPNGRHIVFTTTRWGKLQLAMIDLTGAVSKRRITETGNNKFPTWSRHVQ